MIMKKILFISAILLIASNSLFSQNIGIIVGGSNAKMLVSGDGVETSINDSINSKLSFRGGFAFEGVLIPKKFYLQLGLLTQGKGMLSPDGKEGASINYGQLELDLKYKFHFDSDDVYYLYLSVGGYIGGAYNGSEWTGSDVKKIEFGSDPKFFYRPVDVGMNFGAGIGLGQFQISYTYGMGLKNISTIEVDNFALTNSVHSITLGFYFTTN